MVAEHTTHAIIHFPNLHRCYFLLERRHDLHGHVHSTDRGVRADNIYMHCSSERSECCLVRHC